MLTPPRGNIDFRPDADAIKFRVGEKRPSDRLLAHYELERSLAARLRSAARSERATVYGQVYRELFESLPDHPQNTRRKQPRAERVDRQVRAIAKYLTPASSFLEIGCGDGALAIRMAEAVAHAYGLDVTDSLLPTSLPENFTFVKTDGVAVALPDSSIDFAYSNQLVEHLHPDDAKDQFQEIRRTLRPGGKYFCTTPNRLTGPHDISCYFAYEADGFHLKEYDHAGLRQLFLDAGYSKVKVQLKFSPKGRGAIVPFFLVRLIERGLLALPAAVRSRLVRNSGLGITMIGEA
jgi:SAM-dependent methyltransferase